MSTEYLNIYRSMKPPVEVLSDAAIVRDLDTDILEKMVLESINFFLNKMILHQGSLDESSKKMGVTPDVFLSSFRFLRHIIGARFTVTEEEFKKDLLNLRFTPEKIELIIKILDSQHAAMDDYLRTERVAVVPSIETVHWNIDIRMSSSEYLPKPEIFTIIRFFTKGSSDPIRFELDKNELIWFDKTLEKIKESFIAAERRASETNIF